MKIVHFHEKKYVSGFASHSPVKQPTSQFLTHDDLGYFQTLVKVPEMLCLYMLLKIECMAVA